MRRERRRLAYWITAGVTLLVGLYFIWPLDDWSIFMRLLFIVALMLWMQVTVWLSIRKRRHRRSSSAKSQIVP